jgi:hypothetical protein
MDTALRDRFMHLWERYFGGAELPITLYYTDDEAAGEHLQTVKEHTCIVAQIGQVTRGKTLSFSAETIGCAGGQRYLGFTHEVREGFEYFLSCGIPGKMEGERYKKTPEIVKEAMAAIEPFEAPAKYAVFKRWDHLGEADEPQVVIFFANSDTLSGLYTLAGFDETDAQSVICPFGAGCSTIAQYPFAEAGKEHPKAVLGMFDVSARPFMVPTFLSFAVPMGKFVRMVENMDESFLITPSWAKVLRRMGRT